MDIKLNGKKLFSILSYVLVFFLLIYLYQQMTSEEEMSVRFSKCVFGKWVKNSFT